MIKRSKKSIELPSDVLSVIYEKLDIDDQFSFGQVCKNWRMIHSNFWHDFKASQAPLILQKTPCAKKSCSFYSIFDGRMYNTKLPNFCGFSFKGFSSGYMVMVSRDTVMLINPFSRKMMKIPGPPDQGNIKASYERAILAFVVNSKEFLVVLSSSSRFKLHIYESRSSSWVIFSIKENPWKIMDVVVFRNSLYAITSLAELKLVKLNSRRLRYQHFFQEPQFAGPYYGLKLVSSEDELLVVCFKTSEVLIIYKVDFSTLTWIRLKTLGDRTLFLGAYSECYSLSNPGMWGFESNCVYCIGRSPICKVFSMDKQVIRTLLIPEYQLPLQAKLCNIDWCFRARREVVDYGNLHEGYQTLFHGS